MGLFSFKSSEQKKQEELLKKMKSEIFPQGQIQIDKEIQEVRELLEFKYSKEAIQQTYLYAAPIYYLSHNKDMNEIVDSILKNQKTSVTAEDAIKIYCYLQIKFSGNKLQELVNKVNNFSDSYKLFMIAKGGIVELKNAYKDLSSKGKFEVILANMTIILLVYHERYPEKYQKALDGIFILLFNQARDYDINTPKELLRNFINSRFEFYTNELVQAADNSNYLQFGVYNNFYINPLADMPEGNDEDLFEYMVFLPAYYKMIGWVRNRVSNFV